MKCKHDPTLTTGPIGMYHCPECGLMVVAGFNHGDICDCEQPGQYDYSSMCDTCTPGWADALDALNKEHEEKFGKNMSDSF
jgi:hypothetical protein